MRWKLLRVARKHVHRFVCSEQRPTVRAPRPILLYAPLKSNTRQDFSANRDRSIQRRCYRLPTPKHDFSTTSRFQLVKLGLISPHQRMPDRLRENETCNVRRRVEESLRHHARSNDCHRPLRATGHFRDESERLGASGGQSGSLDSLLQCGLSDRNEYI